jgi:hypothetical protein
MREVWEDSLWCEVAWEKVEELGEPVREDNEASRSFKVALAGGLNERAVAILLLFEELDRRMMLCNEHLRGLLCPSQSDTAESEQLRGWSNQAHPDSQEPHRHVNGKAIDGDGV